MTIVAIIDALGASVDKLISEVRQLDHGVTVVRNVLQTKDGTSLPLLTDRADRRMDCRVIALSSRQKPNDVVMDKPLFGYVLDGGLRLTYPMVKRWNSAPAMHFTLLLTCVTTGAIHFRDAALFSALRMSAMQRARLLDG